jgi:iron complex transport system substrate-binding protein
MKATTLGRLNWLVSLCVLVAFLATAGCAQPAPSQSASAPAAPTTAAAAAPTVPPPATPTVAAPPSPTAPAPATPTVAAPASPKAAPSPSAMAASGKRTVTDALGNKIEIPAVVNRVADAWPANVGMVLMLGGADKLVGITDQAQNQPWLRKLYPRVKEIPLISSGQSSGDLNIETLIQTKPDVLLMSYAGGMPTWMDKVKEAKIPVVLMPANNYEEMKTAIRITAEVLGPSETAVAEEWLKYYDGNIKRISTVIASVPKEQRPKVLHTLRPTILTVDGVGGLVNDWITNSGGVNVTVEIKGNSGTATMEQIIKWNPDIIIVGTEPNTENAQKIMTDPQWAGIKAVKDKRVYVNPTGVYLWDRHSGEGALQILWAAKLLYPDKFQDIDLKKETKAFFTKFFHYDLTDADYDSIINAKAP